jgi:hypothetical protein
MRFGGRGSAWSWHGISRNPTRAFAVLITLACLAFTVTWLATHVERNVGNNSVSASASEDEEDVFRTCEDEFGGEGKRLIFDRDVIVTPGCEGYWSLLPPPKEGKGGAEGNVAKKASLETRYPWPMKREEPFCGETEWLRRLKYIQEFALAAEKRLELAAAADDTTATTGRVAGSARKSKMLDELERGFGLRILRQRGLTQSRIDQTFLGNKEFYDEDYTIRPDGTVAHVSGKSVGGGLSNQAREKPPSIEESALEERPGKPQPLCWTGDFAEHYVGVYHVRPSRPFYHYVIQKYNQIRDAEKRDLVGRGKADLVAEKKDRK